MSKCYFGCGRELKPNSKLESCQVCRNAMGAALRRGADWFIGRTRKLKLYLARNDNVARGTRKIW